MHISIPDHYYCLHIAKYCTKTTHGRLQVAVYIIIRNIECVVNVLCIGGS